MIEAILFDMDGTLLDIDMDFFLGKYFEEMAKMAITEDKSIASRLIEQILISTDAMINNTNPRKYNEEVFMEHFLTNMKAEENKMRSFFDEFYNSGFPRLKEYCRPFQGIPEMMADVFNRGYKVVIATNPVFPRRAIQLRLDWAGVGNFPYQLITCYENMHYCKPYPHYYREIAELIDVDPKTCLMIGNDTGEDLAAKEIGMKTFLVEDCLIDKGNSSYQPDWRGKLPDLYRFLAGLPTVSI